jgi:hypothetical protein
VLTLFGAVMFAVGLDLLWLPFKLLRKAAQTIYGLTDRRLLQISAD